MYDRVEARVKEVVPLEKLSYVAFLHFESDGWVWGGEGWTF
ncbi:MAG: hypothetical protein AB1753_07825 [Thermoproteota archaeon]